MTDTRRGKSEMTEGLQFFTHTSTIAIDALHRTTLPYYCALNTTKIGARNYHMDYVVASVTTTYCHIRHTTHTTEHKKMQLITVTFAETAQQWTAIITIAKPLLLKI